MNCAQKGCALTIDIVPKTKEKTSIAQQMIEWEKPEAKLSSFDFECVVRLEKSTVICRKNERLFNRTEWTPVLINNAIE